MARSTVHYADSETNNILRRLHNKLRPAGTPVQRVEYIIELLLLRIFEVKLKHDKIFAPLRQLFEGDNYHLLFSHLLSLTGEQVLSHLNQNIFPFYASILSKSRQVFAGNLPQKAQDQLVLIEEVFANSSFSTNVQSGNMSEIISLVAEIDEKRVIKTDLLGDAIESALSETGGTRDIGLYRTPDHIRQMMVALVDPDFTDSIFDPACGTGGFLFDSYQYVLEKTTKDGKWPGEKAHQEIKKYFREYFSEFDSKMPSADIAANFYRAGIGGIEYLGMIRKMAAINLYIRGLNPQNIQQGDSLRIFDPATDANTKSVVIANPPFGAERDQPAYPNVWEEHARESETTILFVKLMFDLLRPGGRCAVVVSEGFLTWGQSSARALRKKLLEEANLKAIISIPQGVFVSKSGQGAKTSILYFEKGEQTKQVWYYKIKNDGYSLGVNRKPIKGCQIPEVIELFTKYIREGKTPPDTNHSFMIPAEWIKTLDPRIKQRIRIETKREFTEKKQEKRKKLVGQLNEKKAKGKLSKKDYNEKVWQFDNVWENKTQNQIAKRIEKEYFYSFNLQNYRSNLRREQIKAWSKKLSGISPTDNSIDERYEKLEKADAKTALSIFASFDPNNALEMDIVREYLSKMEDKNENLKKLEEILKKGLQYPLVPLKSLLKRSKEKIKPEEYSQTEFVVLGVSNQDGIFINERKLGDEINQSYYQVEPNQFCYNPYRVNVGSIGLNEFNYKNQIISGAYIVFSVDETELLPRYLMALFKSKRFITYVNEMATGGVRMNFKFDFLQDWHIPKPPLDIQKKIVEKIERQKSIIEGAEKILEGWEIDQHINFTFPLYRISTIAHVDASITKDLKPLKDKPYIGAADIESGTGRLLNIKSVEENGIKGPAYIFRKGQVIYSKVRPYLRKCFYANFDGVCSSDIYPLTVQKDKVNAVFLSYFLATRFIAEQTKEFHERAGMPKINRKQLAKLKASLPPLNIQKKIVLEIKKELEVLEQVRILKSRAEERIENILEEVWGKNNL